MQRNRNYFDCGEETRPELQYFAFDSLLRLGRNDVMANDDDDDQQKTQKTKESRLYLSTKKNGEWNK